MCLKYHVHAVGHLDDLAVHQAKTLVVVKDRVHVLNPLGIDGSIEDDPPSLKAWLDVGAEAEDATKYAVCELLGNCIIISVQLRQGDALRIDNVRFHRFFFERVRRGADEGKRFRQNTISRGLATVCGTHNH